MIKSKKDAKKPHIDTQIKKIISAEDQGFVLTVNSGLHAR